MILLTALALQAAAPSAEALDLGRRVAASGMLARMIPLIAEKEVGEIIADHPELTATEQATLRDIAKEKAESGRAKLVDGMAGAYAGSLSIEDMKAIAAFNESPVAARWKAAEPAAIMAAVKALDGLDYKGSVQAAMCTKTGKVCGK